jgi:adenosylcobinamide kinase/adenosylcobinamide-phosphate guanylyltransferase
LTAPSRTVLVLGGARSGKSRHAEALTEARVGPGQRPVYLATAEAGDDEMRRRIDEHRARRGSGWTTREEPFALADALVVESRPGRPILVDCLTLWLSNLLHAARDADAAAALLAHAVARVPGPVVLVANEIGLGIVPDNKLARDFRDRAGRLNQDLAATCEAVVLVAAGLPLTLKGTP